MDAAATGTSESRQLAVLAYRLNEDDLTALNRRVRLLWNLTASTLGWVFWLGTLALLLLFGWFNNSNVIDLAPALFVWLIALSAVSLSTRYFARMRLRATYKPSQLDVRLVAEDRHIQLQGGDDSSVVSWKSIERGEETRSHFLLFLTRLQALIIPKRAFADESELGRFRQLISERVKDFILVGRS